MKTTKEIRAIVGTLMQEAKYQVNVRRSHNSAIVEVEYLDYLPREELYGRAVSMFDGSTRLILSRGYTEAAIKDLLFSKYRDGELNLLTADRSGGKALRPEPVRQFVFRELETASL